MVVLRALNPSLPAKWDGRAVTWERWSFPPAVNVCVDAGEPWTVDPNALGIFDDPATLVPERSCCACGSAAQPRVSTGLVAPLPGEEFTVWGRPRRGRFGRMVQLPEQRPAWALRCLHATRCVDCGHDDVLVMGGEDFGLESATWCLDESDYGPEGSTAP